MDPFLKMRVNREINFSTRSSKSKEKARMNLLSEHGVVKAARYQAAKKATGATPSTEPVETPHPLDFSGNASDQPCKFKILQSPLESEKRRSVTRLPRDANLYSFLNLDCEGKE